MNKPTFTSLYGIASAVKVLLITDGLFFTLGKIILPFFDVFALLLFIDDIFVEITVAGNNVLATVVVVVVAGNATYVGDGYVVVGTGSVKLSSAI